MMMGRGGFGMMGGGPGGMTGRGGDQAAEEGGRGDRGRGDRGRGGRGGFDPTAMLSRFDPDGDGQINISDLDERMQGVAKGMMERMGLDTSKPVKIDEVRKAMEARMQGRSTGDSRNRQSEAEKKKKEEEAARIAYRVAGTDRFKGRKSYSPAARTLPKNLPSWWDRKDENGDAQITMSEFMSGSTSSSTKEFFDYDLNEDGTITAREAEIAESD